MSVFQLDEPGNYVLGAGFILFKPAEKSGFRYLAETPELSITVTSTRVELQSVDSRQAEKLEDVVTEIVRDGSMAIWNVDRESLSLFFAGEASVESQASLSAETETFESVELGTSVQLGSTTAAAAPAWGYRSVTVTAAAADPTGTPVALTAGDDYEVDSIEGLVKFLPGSSNVSDGDDVEITYDVAESTTEVVQTNETPSVKGTLKFVGRNTTGIDRTFLFPNVDLGPTGDLALKSRSDFQEIPMEFSILRPSDGGRAVYVLKNPEVT